MQDEPDAGSHCGSPFWLSEGALEVAADCGPAESSDCQEPTGLLPV